MYHISNSLSKKEPFIVINVADNGKVINTSETLKTKQAAFKNIISNMDSVFGEGEADCYCLVQDDTLKNQKVYRLYDTGRKDPYLDTKPIYISGKNKKP